MPDLTDATGASYADLDARWRSQVLMEWLSDANVITALARAGIASPEAVRAIQGTIWLARQNGEPIPHRKLEAAMLCVLRNKRVRHAAARPTLEAMLEEWANEMNTWLLHEDESTAGPKPAKPTLKLALKTLREIKANLEEEIDGHVPASLPDTQA